MTANPITVRSHSTVFDVAKLMREKDIGSVIIAEEENVLGIVTERDLVRRVIAQNQDPHQVRISDVMTTPVVSIPSNEDVTGAAKLMKEKGIRRLVVMKGSELVGIITTDDLTRHMMRVVEEFATALFIMERRTEYDRELIRHATQ
jgi:CBS domain-containing protein